MLNKVYANNFRCLVNFELTLDSPVSLFMGPNGSGKTTVFDVLLAVQSFAVLGAHADQVFRETDKTRWMKSDAQTFAIEVSLDDDSYIYELSVGFRDGNKAEVRSEHLRLTSGQTLLRAQMGNVELYRDDFQLDASYPLDPSLSAIALLPTDREGNRRILAFRQFLRKLIVVQLNPPMMSAVSEQEERILLRNSANFVSWFRHLSLDIGLTSQIGERLKEALDGFKHLRFMEVGPRARLLMAHFGPETNARSSDYSFSFAELSDGERMLIALYTILEYARQEGYTLCIDEPENFLALPEIQPWLLSTYDHAMDDELQAILISHHPELIDYLAVSNGIWLERPIDGPTRLSRIDVEEGGLPVSELVARGWIDG